MDSDKRLKWDENPNYKMKQGKQNIKQLLNEIVKNRDEIYSIVAKVTSVDETERTCDVEPINGDAEIFGVRLQADINSTNGFVMIPTVDSNVVVTFLNQSTGFVSVFSDVEKIHVVSNTEMTIDCSDITFNGGSNDGLVIVGNLVNKLNAIENWITQFATVWSTHVHTDPISGSTGTTVSPAPTPPTTTIQSDLENTEIKH